MVASSRPAVSFSIGLVEVGEPQAVIADGPGYVATGTVGAPDNYIPTVWLSPPNR